MNRKHQLQELIRLNNENITLAQSRVEEFLKELHEIESKENRPVDRQLQQLRRLISTEPTTENYAHLTRHSLRCESGNFVVWRGAQGAPEGTSFIEIEQPLFISENTTTNAPTLKTHFQAIAIESIEDLKRFLPQGPSGLVSLPSGEFLAFRSGVAEAARLLREQKETGSQQLSSWPPSRNLWYEPLYDTCDIVSSRTQYHFFQVPVGGTPQHSYIPKSFVETNMVTAASLPGQRSFYITGISVVPAYTTNNADTITFIENSWCRLIIGMTDYLFTPAKMMMPATTSQNPLANFRLNDPLEPVFVFPEIVELLPLQNFRFEISFIDPPQFSQAFRAMVVLHGYSRIN